MSLPEIFRILKRYNENATVIFDREEPLGRPTDLVMPYRPWFRRRARAKKAARHTLSAKIS